MESRFTFYLEFFQNNFKSFKCDFASNEEYVIGEELQTTKFSKKIPNLLTNLCEVSNAKQQ